MKLKKGIGWPANQVLVLLAAFGIAGQVSGAESDDPDVLIRDGISFRRNGNDQAGLDRFQRAYELNHSPRAMAQIGLAEQALGRWAKADKHLRQALQEGRIPRDPWVQKHHDPIDSALATVSRHVGQLEVTGTPAASEVRVDGELAGRLPLPGPITATVGGVAIEVTAPGYVSIVRAATITSGSLTRETFTLRPISPALGLSPGVPQPTAGAGTNKSTLEPDRSSPTPTGGSRSAHHDFDGTAVDDVAPSAPPTGYERGRDTSGSGTSARQTLGIIAGGLSLASFAYGIYENVSWQNNVKSFRNTIGCGTQFENNGGPGCSLLFNQGQAARTHTFLAYGLGIGLATTAFFLFSSVGESTGARPADVACAIGPGPLSLGCALRF